MSVQGLEALEHRDRYEKVPSCITDKPFDLAFVVAFAGPAEPVLEQIVRLQFAEHPRSPALAIAQNAGNRDLRVVIQNRHRYAAEECERSDMSVAERFRRLGWVGHYEDRVGMWQVHRKEVDLALDTTNHTNGFSKVCLGMPWRMRKRHEHLPRPLTPVRNVVLHDRELAGKAVFVAQSLKYTLARVMLLLQSIPVSCQNRIYDASEPVKLRPQGRPLAYVSWRNRELQHLRDRSGVDAEPFCCSPFADPLNHDGVPNSRV